MPPLVLAEAQSWFGFAPQGVPHELAIALWAEVEATALINILADFVLALLRRAVQNVLNLHEVVPVFVRLVFAGGIHRGLNLNLHDVPQIIRGQLASTAVATVMNHKEPVKARNDGRKFERVHQK